MNHKLEKINKLLGLDGSLLEPGWATRLLHEYSPFDVKTDPIRIKEWDYYVIVDDDFAFSTVISDNRYLGLATASFFDFKEHKKYSYSVPVVLPMGKMHMPSTSEKGDIYYRNKRCKLSFIHEKGGRRLTGHYFATPNKSALDFDIFLESNKTDDTMVIATPWEEDKTAFYYNQKINCMPAKGYIKIGDKKFDITPEKHFGTLDWGRGVWPFECTWYWGSGNGYIDGKRFGFNIGYGFGNTTRATENMIFYDGKCHKLDKIYFDIPENIMQPWGFLSSDGRFNMRFVPIYDNSSHVSAFLLSRSAHQVFGKMSGSAVLDDGTVLKIKDLTVFAEKVMNRN
jgi:hypothetical protein